MKTIALAFFLFTIHHVFAQTKGKAVFLEDIDWVTAKNILNEKMVVVIPLGAGAKEHGPHLPLSADLIQADYFKKQIAQLSNVVIAPTVTYSFYPLFLQFAGSTSVSYTTARDMILEIVRSLAGYGVRRFYIINIGISTIPPLTEARNILLNEGIVLSFNFLNMASYATIEKSIKKMQTGTHADELEPATSC